MPRYSFDVRDRDRVTGDTEGLELDGIESAGKEAVQALCGIAKDAVRRPASREFAIEVKDSDKQPLLSITLQFEVQRLR